MMEEDLGVPEASERVDGEVQGHDETGDLGQAQDTGVKIKIKVGKLCLNAIMLIDGKILPIKVRLGRSSGLSTWIYQFSHNH